MSACSGLIADLLLIEPWLPLAPCVKCPWHELGCMKKCATFSSVHSVSTTAVPLYDTVNRDCLLTCKCPWYILSTQSVADLSVSGCSDFFQTCEVDCQAVSVDMSRCGKSLGSGAVLSPRVLKRTLCSSRISVRGDTEARRAHETDGGLHFYLPLTVCWRRIVVAHAEIKSPRIKSSFWRHCRVSSLSLTLSPAPESPPPLSLSSAGCGFKYSDAPQGLDSSYSALLFPVCQLLPLTQPSGASFSADVLCKEAHGDVSTHTSVSKMYFSIHWPMSGLFDIFARF